MNTVDGFDSVDNPSFSTLKNRPLGKYGSIASASLSHLREKTGQDVLRLSPTVLRFYLQSLARELLPSEAVATCLRFRQADRPLVEVYKNDFTERAHFAGLQTCKSLWHCAYCAARISEGRRQELSAALLDAHVTDEDGSVTVLVPVLVTYTVQHNKGMMLPDLLAGLLAAFRKMKSGRGFQTMKTDYEWVGSVRSLEVTYGRNGWHPHIHELVLLRRVLTVGQLAGLKTALKGAWRDSLGKVALSVAWDYGVDVRVANDDITAYIAKFGREPKNEGWTITHELVKSGSKKSGGRSGFSMLELLQMYGEGDLAAGHLWQGYARAFKGRNQLVWSRGLRDLLGIGAEKSDAELAVETESPVDRLLAALTADQWRAILRADVRGELLDKAAASSDEEFNLWLADIFERYQVADLAAAGVGVRVFVGADGAYKFA